MKKRQNEEKTGEKNQMEEKNNSKERAIKHVTKTAISEKIHQDRVMNVNCTCFPFLPLPSLSLTLPSCAVQLFVLVERLDWQACTVI